MANKCTSVAARFEGFADAPEQYRWHFPMRHVQGYSGSHWTPASGNYLLRIAPVAARQQANKQQSTNAPKRVAVLMAMAMRQYVTMHIARWRRFRALLDATKRHHRASIVADLCNRSRICRFFMSFFFVKIVQKGHRLMLRPLFSIGVLHIKRKKRA